MNAPAILPDNNGVRLPNGVRRPPTKHASRGGNPYPDEMRQQVLAMWQNGGGVNGGYDALDTPQLQQLRLQKKFPHLDTCKRWIRIHQQEGHVRPKRATGNAFSTREIQGEDLVHLALFRLIRPKAYVDEVRAYLHNRNPAVDPYSKSQVSRAEKRLGLYLKVGSSTSDEAYRPANLQKRRNYWSQQYPDGINGEDTSDMIDIDEACFKVTDQQRKRGKTLKCSRCDTRGLYKKGEGGCSLLMGISGDDIDPFEFHQQFSEGGTDLWRFYCFMRDFIDWLATNRPGRTFCFTMDNLNVHKHPSVLNLIENAGHRVVFRAPYWSCDGPIEYVFNTIHTLLQMDDEGVKTLQELMLKIDDLIFDMVETSFRPYFVHVGFNN